MGSDHALIQVDGHTHSAATHPPTDATTGFVTNLDQKEEWIRAFKARSSPLLLPFTPTTEEVEQAAVGFTKDIQSTNKQIFCRR